MSNETPRSALAQVLEVQNREFYRIIARMDEALTPVRSWQALDEATLIALTTVLSDYENEARDAKGSDDNEH